MAKEKQSDIAFLMMKEWREQLALLSDEQRGILLTAIYDYQCDGVNFYSEDVAMNMLWISIKKTFERNNKKYEQVCEINRQKAQKRWGNDAAASFGINKNAENADRDSDREREKDSDSECDREADRDIYTSTLNKAVDYYNLLINYDYADIMDEYDISHTHIKAGELCALYDIVEENPLERYLVKSHEYKSSPDPAKMILRWAAQDGNIKKAPGHAK